MERVNDILKSIIGILLLLSVVFTFSSCEKKTETTSKETETHKEHTTSDEWKEKMKKESQELDKELETLKEKAKKSGGKAEEEINKTIDKINAEKEELMKDSTNEKMSEKWDRFKQRVKTSVDSLNKKL
jgi:septal ring factor EnvC (AmiA/AmiB activator)